MNHEAQRLVKILGGFVIVVLIFLGGFFIGRVSLQQQFPYAAQNQYKLTGELKEQYQGADLNILWETWAQLDREYINSDIDAQKLVYGAVKGSIASLGDPYTAFLSPDEAKEYYKTNAGEYEGIGATLKQEDNMVAVESPISHSPAEKAGLLAGDIILKVDGVDVSNKSVYEVVGLIRGKAGTQVVLNIYRPAKQEEKEIPITRAAINIDNIEVTDLGSGIVKIKILRFTESDVASFYKLWDKAVSDALAKNPKGIVIDLRNNPGGYVSAVEYVLGDFISKGKIVFIEESRTGGKVEYKVSRDGRLLDIPISVLVNQGSASASEIFSGAIQDHARGKVVGMPTVGKGVEQKLITLSDQALLQVVFQKWLTPNGKNITKDEPIKPDFEIEDQAAQDQKAMELLLK